MIVVQSNENEAPYGRFDPPIAQYAQAMRPLKGLVMQKIGDCPHRLTARIMCGDSDAREEE